MAIKMICSDIDGTLLQYGRKSWRAKFSTRSAPCMTAASCSARHPGAVHQPAPAVCAGGRLLCFPVRERRRAVQGRALHRREPDAPRTGGGNCPRPVGPQRRPGRGHALGPELRLSDGARPRYAGPHPIYRQPLQGHLRPVRDPRGDRQGVGLPA